jgi:hypothetical protein
MTDVSKPPEYAKTQLAMIEGIPRKRKESFALFMSKSRQSGRRFAAGRFIVRPAANARKGRIAWHWPCTVPC